MKDWTTAYRAAVTVLTGLQIAGYDVTDLLHELAEAYNLAETLTTP